MKITFFLLFLPLLLFSKNLINKNDYFKTLLISSNAFELNYKLGKTNDKTLINNFLYFVKSNKENKKIITFYKSKKNNSTRYIQIKDGQAEYQIFYIKSECKYYINSNSKKYNNLYIDKKDLLSLNKKGSISLKSPLKFKYISSHFSKKRLHPILKKYRSHNGVDFVNTKNTPIRASASGVITKIGRNGSYGKYIEIKHNNGFYTEYAHLNKYNKRLKRGMKVKVGQVIGFLGNTGRSTGPHLHFGLRHYKKFLNPLLYIKQFEPNSFLHLTKKNRYLKNNQKLNRNIRIIRNKLKSIRTV